MMRRFFLYGLLGWGMEILWTGLGSLLGGDKNLSSFTSLWMFLIYGSAIFLEPIHDIIRRWPWPARGVIWVVIIWGAEYTSGLVLREAFGIEPWAYSGPYAVDSLVRLDYGPAWFVAGLFFERIHNTLDTYGVA